MPAIYYRLLRWFPKRPISRLMGLLAAIRWPRWLLAPAIRCYIFLLRIDMTPFVMPEEGFSTFNAFFTRALRPGSRPQPSDPQALACPVDGTVTACGPVCGGRLLQAKGWDYALGDLLGRAAGWEGYEGGEALTLYLSPRDYHRIHSPCTGEVTRFAYEPGDLWPVGPLAVRGVPGLFARNERVITFIRAPFGELALVAVGATVVGGVKVVYHPLATNQPRARAHSATLQHPFPIERGAELGRFELGSTVILLSRPGEASWEALRPGDSVRMGQVIGHAAVAEKARRSQP